MNKKIILIIEIFAVVAIVGGFIYFTSKFKERSKPVSTPFNMSQPATGPELVKPPTTPPSGQSVQNVPANWKTYKNDKYGFEFKYPKDFLSDENQPGYIVSVRGQNDNSGYGSFSVDIRAASASDVNDDIKFFEKLGNYRKTSIAGNQAFYSASSYTEDGKKYTEYLVVNQNNTIMYRVLFVSDNTGEKIFSTLKFIK